jgi:hypothetical protein
VTRRKRDKTQREVTIGKMTDALAPPQLIKTKSTVVEAKKDFTQLIFRDL